MVVTPGWALVGGCRLLLVALVREALSSRELIVVGAAGRRELLDRELLGVALEHSPRHACEQLAALTEANLGRGQLASLV